MAHPYLNLEGTPLWMAVEAAVADLVANHDLAERTARTHIVGYVCQAMQKDAEAIAHQLQTS